ncbi:MAG TPA: hypothetical protein VGJ75_03460 [Dongiaceae bacterium]|jgi:acyl dehydratase
MSERYFDDFAVGRTFRPAPIAIDAVDSGVRPAGGLIGAGRDELRWPRPVRPDDELYLESDVLEMRLSKSRPNKGLIKMRTTTLTP